MTKCRIVAVIVAVSLTLSAGAFGAAKSKNRNPDHRKERIAAAACELTGRASVPDGDMALWYRQPAAEWVEALPIGNGRLGAMVYGGVNREWLQLNEDTLWTGRAIDRNRKDVTKALDRAREMIFEGKYVEAQAFVQENIMGTRVEKGLHTYQTLGDLELTFPERDKVSDYRRQLDLDTAVASTSYRAGNAVFTREVFSSPADQAIVMRLTCDKTGMITFDAALSRPADATVKVISADTIVMHGQVRASDKLPREGVPSADDGVEYSVMLRIIPDGGRLRTIGQTLKLEKANSATLVIVAATNYRGLEPRKICRKQLASAAKKSYRNLRSAHLAEHRRLFSRVTLDLGGVGAVNNPTDVRLNAVIDGGFDPQLIAQYFQYGRYLLICSSRPGNMPANLQGLWADGLIPPWNADYHININIQMNYWPAELCNLSECHEPFFDLIDGIRKRGRVTAKEMFGCRGFVAGHTTDAWLHGSIIGKAGYGMWPVGGAWSTRHLWERYLFRGDREFLKERAYPAMKESVEFFLDWLVENPKTGLLVSGPSTSPENKFSVPGGGSANLTMGPTMDQQIIYDLFTNCIEAAEILGVDRTFRRELQKTRDRLAPTRIGSDGRLMEWPEEFGEPSPGHRHVSHLYGLHPANLISITETPKFAAAARKTLDYRLANGGGHTGWSRAWLINFFARLQDGNACQDNIQALLANSTLPNMFDNHPPFQIDGNFGGCAAIAEMLVQSHAGEIHLLPALPDAWQTGEVTGLRARGGFEVDVYWKNGKLTKAVIASDNAATCKLHYASRTTEHKLKAGQTLSVDGKLKPAH